MKFTSLYPDVKGLFTKLRINSTKIKEKSAKGIIKIHPNDKKKVLANFSKLIEEKTET